MVNYTPNLNLAKPILSDVADITVISANFDILDSALAKMVTTDSPQTITGTKSFESSLYLGGNNYVKKSGSRGDLPSSNTQRWWMIQRGSVDNLDQASIGSVTGSNGKRWLFASVYDADGKYRDVSILRDTEIGAGSNGEHIVPLSYLNSESKATFLVHRAGAETLTGIKTFYSGEFAPIRLRRNNANFDVKTRSADRPDADYDLFSAYMFDTNNVEILREYVRMRKDGSYADKWATFYDDNGVAHHPQFGLATRKSDGVSYAYCTETPNNAPNNAIVTKGYAKMVTTDTEQTITGKKTFDNTSNTYKGSTIDLRRAGYGNNVIVGRRDYNISDITTNLNMGFVTFHDVKDDVSGYMESYVNKQGQVAGQSTPYSRLALMSRSPNQTYTKGIEIYSGDNGNAYINGFTPSPNSPSTALLTKGEVYGVNNLSNNLVHTIGDEFIDGVKSFKYIPRCARIMLTKSASANLGWYRAYVSESVYTTSAQIRVLCRADEGYGANLNGIVYVNGGINWNSAPTVKLMTKELPIRSSTYGLDKQFLVGIRNNRMEVWVKRNHINRDRMYLELDANYTDYYVADGETFIPTADFDVSMFSYYAMCDVS